MISWVCETGNVTESLSRYAKGWTVIEIFTGETPDITEYLDFALYDWVTYKKMQDFRNLQLANGCVFYIGLVQ